MNGTWRDYPPLNMLTLDVKIVDRLITDKKWEMAYTDDSQNAFHLVPTDKRRYEIAYYEEFIYGKTTTLIKAPKYIISVKDIIVHS